jgi:hypothetical protein
VANGRACFGPPAYRTTFANATLVSLNTYDWSKLDQGGAWYAVSAWGGQVREDQLAWLHETLGHAQDGAVVADPATPAGVGCQAADGDCRVLTFPHRSPSWMQDRYEEANPQGAPWDQLAEEADGVPVLEQVTRGLVPLTTTGQGWSGENRLAARDTLRDLGVDLHLPGHTHVDRVARGTGQGTIVETPQKDRPGLDVTKLHEVTRDDEARVPDQDEARAKLLGHTHDENADAPGPLYLDTTTAASGTDPYFGHRGIVWHPSPDAFPEDALGVPPLETGVAMDEATLEELAREPDRWNPDRDELGLQRSNVTARGGPVTGSVAGGIQRETLSTRALVVSPRWDAPPGRRCSSASPARSGSITGSSWRTGWWRPT